MGKREGGVNYYGRLTCFLINFHGFNFLRTLMFYFFSLYLDFTVLSGIAPLKLICMVDLRITNLSLKQLGRLICDVL